MTLPPRSYQSNEGGVQSQIQALNRDMVPAALEEQLGLRLEQAKVQVEFLTIEHAEKPAEGR
jgi:uncharacterized protein (TIGR03435 family)